MSYLSYRPAKLLWVHLEAVLKLGMGMNHREFRLVFSGQAIDFTAACTT
jgi:hypothetical protein